ncbi:MAG TPA: hypothetical protein VFR06_03395 [Gallionellaceae bacterium]|nr:hypothetical protein [Gallionellaceae bacterium]
MQKIMASAENKTGFLLQENDWGIQPHRNGMHARLAGGNIDEGARRRRALAGCGERGQGHLPHHFSDLKNPEEAHCCQRRR